MDPIIEHKADSKKRSSSSVSVNPSAIFSPSVKKPAIKIKTEVYDKVKLIEVVKILRGNNNVKENCGRLAEDMITFLKYGIMPTQATSTDPSEDYEKYGHTTSYEKKFIKKENGEPVQRVQCTASILPLTADAGLNSLVPPILDYPQDEKGTIDLDHPGLLNLTAENRLQPSSNYSTINAKLIRSAQENGIPTYGTISLAKPSAAKSRAGDHVIVFYATAEEVFYIDPQYYDGEKSQDNGCVFGTLVGKYAFSDTTPASLNPYSIDCFYTIFNELDVAYKNRL